MDAVGLVKCFCLYLRNMQDIQDNKANTNIISHLQPELENTLLPHLFDDCVDVKSRG